MNTDKHRGNARQLVSTNTVENITRIDFSIPSNLDVLKDSVIKDRDGITIAETYNDGEQVHGGVVDKRLGVTDKTICLTCGEKSISCPGHFGHIELVEPVFHLGYLTPIKNILGCFCFTCNKLLVNRNEKEIANVIKNKHGKQRFIEMRAICKKVTHCQKDNYGCGSPAHKITIEKKNGNVLILAEPKKKNDDGDDGDKTKKKAVRFITPRSCYDILKSVSDEDYVVIGLDPKISRPENMIITTHAIPPNCVRPSIKSDVMGSVPRMDDLSNKLLDIVKSNESLKDNKGDGSLTKNNRSSDDFMFLQLHVATFFSNDQLGLLRSQQKNKTVTISMAERLKGKEGRIRANLMGKRVDMSARTVISSDPFISINEVGIPLIFAKNLTYPEVVTEYNMEYLTQLVKNGRRVYPGANFVVKTTVGDDGTETKVSYNIKWRKTQIKLEPGDIVRRHLVDGDVVIFNRQPSLHKLSLMGHRIHVVPIEEIRTARVNVTVTKPYGADFDGDEMNFHVPQSIQTTTEVLLIMSADRHFINPATTNIVISVTQDSLMGSYNMVKDDMKIDWKDAMNIMMASSLDVDCNIPKNKMISGKYLFSEIIPKQLNIIKKNSDGTYQLRIINGRLIDGKMSSSELGIVMQNLWFGYGSGPTTTYVDDLQRFILTFLMKNGHTVSIKDTIISNKTKRKIYNIIETKRKESLGFITEYENDPSVMSSSAFENTIRQNLSSSTLSDIAKTVINNLSSDNGILTAVKSGSSGTEMNPAQIIGCVGQVLVEEKRPLKKFNGRTLPTFAKHDNSAFARGFCYNGFSSGLTATEYFFHVMSGREGLINTAIKTGTTGYIQRKIIKFLEDLSVKYDGTVRNANDKMIQCVYGDNGINAAKQIEQKIILIGCDNEQVLEKYIYSEKELKSILKQFPDSKYDAELNDKLYNKLIYIRNKLRNIQRSVNISQVIFRESYRVPVDINQLIINITSKVKRDNDIVDPYYVIQNVKKMYTGYESRILKYNSKSIIKKKDEAKTKFLLKVYLFDVLSPKRCTHEYKLSVKEFDNIVKYFNHTILVAKVEGGEMVGFVGSQSIGEPITQSNLKSFHKAGTIANAAGGVIRAQELLAITKDISTPITEIYLEEKYKQDKVIATAIASHINYTTLKHVYEKVDIIYDPHPLSKTSVMTKDGVTSVFENKSSKSGCQTEINNLPWTLRIVLSKEKMIEYSLSMLEIKSSFCHNWEIRHEDNKGNKKEFKRIIEKITQTAIVSNFDNSPVPIVHVRFDTSNTTFNVMKQFMDMIINKYRIKGIPGVIVNNGVHLVKYIDFEKDTGKVVTKEQYVIYAQGINLQEISHINGIDLAKTRCNHIVMIYEKYGVEAARAAYIREFTAALDSSGLYCNYQHIALLADAITHTGGLIAVNRHGANKLDTDPLSRASFEQTVDQLLDSATFGESDYIRSVSARIMVGTLINGGTGAYDLLLDHDLVCKVLTTEDVINVKDKITKKKSAIDNRLRNIKKTKTKK